MSLQSIESWIVPNLVNLGFCSFVRKAITQCIFKCTQILYAVRQKNNITCSLDIAIKTSHRVIVCNLTLTVQKVSKPLFARLEIVRNTGKVGRKVQAAIFTEAESETHTHQCGIRFV